MLRGFHGSLPLWGQLIKREFDRAIIDIGRFDRLGNEDTLLVVKQGAVRLDHEGVGFTVDEEDVVGTLTVSALDENMAEGIIDKRSFFDLVNPGDELIFPPVEADKEQSVDETDEGLLRRLFGLIGL